MRHYLLAGHGKWAEGMASAAELIIGVTIPYFNAYLPGEGDFVPRLEEEMRSYPPEDEVVILTDLKGGSVNNELLKWAQVPNVHLICGTNLALVLQLMTSDQEGDITEILQDAIREAQQSMADCQEITGSQELDDF